MDGMTLKELILAANPHAQRIGSPQSIHTPAKLRPKHRNAIILSELGYNNKQIAEAIGYGPSRVSVILGWKTPETEAIRKEVREKALEAAHDTGSKIQLAAREMLDILLGHARQTENRPLSRLAARDILGMAGYTPVKRTIQLNANVPAEQLVGVAEKIQKANEVVVNSDQWTVKKVANDR